MTRKIIALTMTLLIICVVLVGCDLNKTENSNNQGTVHSSDVAEKIERNLDIIVSSPATSSNPGDYIDAHKAEYDEIIAFGTDALQYISFVFDKGGQTGLRGWIMALACCDILGENNTFPNPNIETGQEWYDAYVKDIKDN